MRGTATVRIAAAVHRALAKGRQRSAKCTLYRVV